jgi:hypothetical protein
MIYTINNTISGAILMHLSSRIAEIKQGWYTLPSIILSLGHSPKLTNQKTNGQAG